MNKSILVLPVLGAAIVAHADLKFDSIYAGTGSAHVKLNGATENVGVGILKFLNGSSTLYTVCGDLSSPLDNSAHSYSLAVTPNDNSGIGKAGHIVSTYFKDALTSNDKATGLQLAVWEAIYDDGATFNASAGKFELPSNSGVSAAALSYASLYYGATSGVANRYSSSACGSQAQFSPVPEPASMAAIGLGAIGVFRRRLLRRNRKK